MRLTVSRQVSEDRQADVDQKVCAAAGDDEDGDGRDCFAKSVVGVVRLSMRFEERTEDSDNHQQNRGDHCEGWRVSRARFGLEASLVLFEGGLNLISAWDECLERWYRRIWAALML